MSSLLQRANEVRRHKSWAGIKEEEIETAVALGRGEVSIPQVTKARGCLDGSGSSTAYRMWNALRKGFLEGSVTLEYHKNKR